MRKPERKDIPGPSEPETIKITNGGGLGSAPQPEPEPEEPKEVKEEGKE